jgi:hypothetical protein
MGCVGLIKLATEKFGANNFPDGKGVNFIIEDNVINQNRRVPRATPWRVRLQRPFRRSSFFPNQISKS